MNFITNLVITTQDDALFNLYQWIYSKKKHPIKFINKNKDKIFFFYTPERKRVTEKDVGMKNTLERSWIIQLLAIIIKKIFVKNGKYIYSRIILDDSFLMERNFFFRQEHFFLHPSQVFMHNQFVLLFLSANNFYLNFYQRSFKYVSGCLNLSII